MKIFKLLIKYLTITNIKMGNQLSCCEAKNDNAYEIKTQKEDEDTFSRAKGHLRTSKPAPIAEQKSEVIFNSYSNQNQTPYSNQNSPDRKLQSYPNAIETPNQNQAQISETNKRSQVLKFKADEKLLKEFLVDLKSQNTNNESELNAYMGEKILEKKESISNKEIYTQDFSSYLNQSEFRSDDIIELPAVYLNKENKTEIYKGSWIVEKREMANDEEIKDLTNYMKFHGYGIFIRSDGNVQEGIFRSGELDGPGKMYAKNGDTFIGNYEKGILNYKGVFIDYAGDIYEGDFRENRMEGKGKEIFIDGSLFTGEYSDNKKNGEGKFVWPDGSCYEGELRDNLFQGYGEYQWSSGLKYKGIWNKGLMEGEGIISTKNGDYYEGDFKNNKKDGFGLFWWNEKKYYLGNWKQGVQHGQGKFFKDGKIMIGRWENGKFIGHLEAEDVKFPQRKFNKNFSF